MFDMTLESIKMRLISNIKTMDHSVNYRREIILNSRLVFSDCDRVSKAQDIDEEMQTRFENFITSLANTFTQLFAEQLVRTEVAHNEPLDGPRHNLDSTLGLLFAYVNSSLRGQSIHNMDIPILQTFRTLIRGFIQTNGLSDNDMYVEDDAPNEQNNGNPLNGN